MSNVPRQMYCPDPFPLNCKAANATTYADNPTSSVTVTPQNTATTSASTDEITENAPLIPQYHAVGASSSYWAFLMPNGNAMPIKNPDGTNKSADRKTRTGVDADTNWLVNGGLTKMKAASTRGRSQIRLPTRCEHKLPALDASRRTNSTTVNP